MMCSGLVRLVDEVIQVMSDLEGEFGVIDVEYEVIRQFPENTNEHHRIKMQGWEWDFIDLVMRNEALPVSCGNDGDLVEPGEVYRSAFTIVAQEICNDLLSYSGAGEVYSSQLLERFLKTKPLDYSEIVISGLLKSPNMSL